MFLTDNQRPQCENSQSNDQANGVAMLRVSDVGLIY